MLRQHSQFFLSLFAIADIALLAAAWVSAYYLRSSFIGEGPSENLPPLKEYLIVLVPLVIIWPLVFRLFGLYRPHRLSSIMGETGDIIKLSTIAFIVMLAVLFLVWSQDYSRSVLIYFYVIGIILLILERWLLREMFHVIRRKGYNTRNALIVGAGNLGQTVATKISAWPATTPPTPRRTPPNTHRRPRQSPPDTHAMASKWSAPAEGSDEPIPRARKKSALRSEIISLPPETLPVPHPLQPAYWRWRSGCPCG